MTTKAVVTRFQSVRDFNNDTVKVKQIHRPMGRDICACADRFGSDHRG
jgi:hypothetical protein